MYACGPTVYSYAHIGNFRTFLTSDLIMRTAQALGWQVTYVSNITDVGHLTDDDFADASGEDKMARALQSKEGERFVNVWDLARYYTESLIADWQLLNLMEPTVRPRATEHITQQIEAIEKLIEGGHAYETESGVYFSVASFPSYGKLSGNNAADQLEATVRDVVVDTNKKDPRDFALWKKDDAHLMQWYSPFGRGFPGWHLECSIMSMAYLGETLDLHAGGEDLIFPHHECEIAQSESLSGKPFSTIWAHTRYLQVEGEKMSKSKGTFFTVRDLTAPESEGGRDVDPRALRLALISGHYRKPYNFTFKTLKDSLRIVERYDEASKAVEEALAANEAGDDHVGERLEAIYERTLNAMLDDLNTPEALAAALEGTKLIRGFKGMNKASAASAQAWLKKTDELLGFLTKGSVAEHQGSNASSASSNGTPPEIQALLDSRKDARKARDFARADAIREEIEAKGYEVMDTPEGARVKKRITI